MKNSNLEENNFSFSKSRHRIKLYKDFYKLYKFGNKIKFNFGEIMYLNNSYYFIRLAISIKKSFCKSSVHRNRIRRIIREFFRLNKYQFKGLDVWVYLKTNVSENDIKEALAWFLESYSRKWDKKT